MPLNFIQGTLPTQIIQAVYLDKAIDRNGWQVRIHEARMVRLRLYIYLFESSIHESYDL